MCIGTEEELVENSERCEREDETDKEHDNAEADAGALNSLLEEFTRMQTPGMFMNMGGRSALLFNSPAIWS